MVTGWWLLLAVIPTVRTGSTQNWFSANKPRDCYEIYSNHGTCSDGIYTIYVKGGKKAVKVYCDMMSDGGGWTVIQRREDGSENFYRRWKDYKKGFGTLTGEFWLGNEYLHWITSGNRQRLHIDIDDENGTTAYAEYDNFAVGSEKQSYELHSIGNFTGDAGDSLTFHLGHKFSTKDKDNDGNNKKKCARQCSGAWWYNKNCCQSNLNGRYMDNDKGKAGQRGIEWQTFKEYFYSCRFSEMKIRPFNVH